MRVIRDYRIHCVTHNGENIVTFRGASVHFLFADTESVPAVGEIVKIQLFLACAKLLDKIVIVVNNGAKLL